MHVITWKKCREFIAIHPDAEEPLRFWYKTTEKAQWKSFADVRATFGKNVDRVGECYVFDIHGNDYRLIATIGGDWKIVAIKHILTHEVYSRGKWKKDCYE